MKKILLALGLLIASALPAGAQGCGPTNPNCIVPTAPAATCDNRAASTQYTCNAINGGTVGAATDLPIYNSSGTGFVDSGVPLLPAGGVNLYASPSGSDTNNTCLNSGTPCTLKGACAARNAIATFLSGSFNITLANGTYSAIDSNNALCSVFGNAGGSSTGLTRLIGASTSGAPSTTMFAVPAGDFGVLVKDGGEVVVNNVEITGGNASAGIESSGQSSVADLNNIFWGTWGTSGAHISAATGSYVNVTSGGETLLANFPGVTHWNLSGLASFSAGGPTNIPSAVSWTGGVFLAASGSPYINLASWTLTGAGVAGSTGARANLSGPGYLSTPGAAPCNSSFPGDQNCAITLGFETSANDPTALPISTYANLPGTIFRYIAGITDGKASNCGDSACTAPGTIVSGGGGALKLLLYADGTNWRLLSGTNAGAGVPQNNLNTQSGNYSIQTTDCGSTINETGAQKTITLPAVAGFATNCVLAVYNANSTRGQILSGFPGALAAAPSNILWPLDTITVQIVNGAWSLQSYPARHKITASITLYVDNTNGNDANDCLAATTGACATRQGAFNYINTWDGNEQAITVSVADGTYTNNLTQNGPFHGNPSVTLTGDLATPSNVLISTTSADGLDLTNGATLTMGGFKFVTTTGGNGINVENASFLTITGAMEYGSTAASQLVAGAGSTITVKANYKISGGATAHWRALQAAQIIIQGSLTITLSGTPAFSIGFAQIIIGGVLQAPSVTFSGSATGPSFVINTNGILNNANGALPGADSTSTIATHGYATVPGTPTISSCGSSPGTANGTDFSGNVTEGTAATGCTITFATGSVFSSCTVSLSTGAAVGISTLGATLVVVHTVLSGNVLYWTCAN
jgi:hypothetical protein